jgi:2-polyprenyl-3-methyl-5-hydroxy-6-metoxy-1,4-benzoquinol methylase
MHERQTNRAKYFEEQAYTTEKYVIPYIREVMTVDAGTKVLEIGCGEGGNLKPFLDMGCEVTGIDLSEYKIGNAHAFFEQHPNRQNLSLESRDIYEIADSPDFTFDLIVLRDTIEHIPDQDRIMARMKIFLKPGGMIFFAFPPWRMPFGGHQQVCRNKLLSALPYFHLLPRYFYKMTLRIAGESEALIQGLMEVRDTQISIDRFHRILKSQNWQIRKQTYYLINPNYEIKFSLEPRVVPAIFNVPILRDFYVTALYCIVSPKK